MYKIVETGNQHSLTPFSFTEVKAGSVLPLNWTWKKKAWRKIGQDTKKRTWKPRERVSPACFPPNHDLLVAVKEFPEVGVTSASQKVILLKGKSVSISNSNVAIAEATGRLKVAPNAPLQPLFPERSDSQFPLTPGGGKIMPWHDPHLQWLLLLAHWW